MKKLLMILFLSAFAALLSAKAIADASKAIQATLVTTKGDIKIELYPQAAPVTVKNFLTYAKADFYDNTIFHRVVKRFVIQAGGFDKNLTPKKTNPPIINESKNGLYNDRWTLSMARTQHPNSATSQFFINMKGNNTLDPRMGQMGYAVFGKVIEGFDVVKSINNLPIKSRGGVFAELTEEIVIIKDVVIHP